MRPRRAPLLIVAIVVAALAGCLPQPDDPIEYLAREDAVLVQMRTGGGWSRFDLTVPEFTLYGDGTVLYVRQDEDGAAQVLRGQMPGQAVQDVLEFMEDEDFFQFQYEQPVIDFVNDAETTYLYAQTKTSANAVSAYALGFADKGEASSDEFSEFRRIAGIRERLRKLDPEEVGGEALGPYEAEQVLVDAFEQPASEVTGDVPAWPVESIDLAEIAGAEQQTRVVRGQAADEILQLAPPESLVGFYRQRNRIYGVGYRPILPFEEHFPEFDFGG
ncbi:MAG: hypothetical protein WEE64_13315 [Dehalococcoidia bacterium]